MSVPARFIDPKLKNRSRLYYRIADLQAQDVRPDGWSLLTDEDGFITEGTGSNVFIASNGELLTPEPRNVLRGVSRQMVMDLARKLEIPCSERNFEPYDVVTADEAFFTSTRFCVMPVVSVDGHTIGSGEPGKLTRSLLNAWSDEVGVDIVEQAKSYAAMIGG
jgi:branched-chain amino acid aminotransferase